MNETITEKLSKIEQFCKSLQTQTDPDTPAWAAYQTVIDQCAMLSASLSQKERLISTLAGKLTIMELEYRANVLIGVWSKFIAGHK